MGTHEKIVDRAATLRAMVRGRVQAVGFRMFVQDEADRLRLRGYVRNTQDGGVEVVACGNRPALERLVALLHEGPPAARVSTVDCHWSETVPDSLPERFEVRH